MDGDKRMTEILGVDRDTLAQKSSNMTRYLLDSKVFGGKTQEEFVDVMRKTFSDPELMFLAIGYITEKTDTILKSMGGVEAIVKEALTNAKSKGSIPPEVIKAMEAMLAIVEKEEKENNKN